MLYNKLNIIFICLLGFLALQSCLENEETEPEQNISPIDSANTTCRCNIISDENYETEIFYNDSNRIIGINNIDKTSDAITSYTEYEYNDEGLPIKVTLYDEAGALLQQATYEHDVNKRIRRVNSLSPDSSGLQLTEYISFTYNENDKITKAHFYYNMDTEFELMDIREYEYNVNGNVSTIKYYDVPDPETPPELVTIEEYIYDDNLSPYNFYPTSVGPFYGSINNPILKIITHSDSEGKIFNHFTYEYNEYGYPITRVKESSQGEDYFYHYSYEYECE